MPAAALVVHRIYLIVVNADPNSWCPQGNFLILIPDEIQVVSW
jgi:hypothetical protein